MPMRNAQRAHTAGVAAVRRALFGTGAARAAGTPRVGNAGPY